MCTDSIISCVLHDQETSLELVVISEDGIVQSVCEQPVFGSIKDLQVLPWNESHRSPQLQVVCEYLSGSLYKLQ